MAYDSVEKTVFATHTGLFEFAFQAVQHPSHFQRLMEAVLAGLTRDSCIVYIDDILVLGSTFDEHLANLVNRLREAGLRLKPAKSHLARDEVEYLVYVVSADGIQVDPRKIEAIRQFSVQRT